MWGNRIVMMALGLSLLGACTDERATLPPAVPNSDVEAPNYIIGPLDSISVFVWRNAELSGSAVVRPDGRVTLPLVEDMQAAGKTPVTLARDVEKALSKYVLDPIVTVSVNGFIGPFSQQIRIVGEAAQPQAIPYRANMTILDVMIAVGGLTTFADGDGTTLIRVEEGKQKEYRVRLADLLKDGDISANVPVLPGDVIIIPQSWF